MNYSPLELLHIQTDALFVHNANKRLLRINESDPDDVVPRFFLARSLVGNIWRVRYDVPNDLADELESLAASEPVLHDLHEPPNYLVNYMALLEQHTALSTINSGPAYYLPELDPPSDVVTITRENMDLLEADYPYTLEKLDERAPVVVAVKDGAAVAICFCARSTTLAAEAGVFTQEKYRGHGYAAQTVRGWAAAIRATGRLPLYSTSWHNTASQAVAMKLGAVQYGVDFSIT